MADDAIIKVERVSKNFVLPHERTESIKQAFTGTLARRRRGKETQHALKDISFKVKEGEFFGIVGRNGSGKSTLLKILAGIYTPTKGAITTNGKLVPFIELGVGFNPELTGRENVYLNGALLGFSKEEINKQYDEIVQFAELEQFMDQKLKNYSSGMQVRLAFSVATRADADILLIDEVLAVGDEDFQRKCFAYFRTLKRNKKTVVFVSHDMEAVKEYCDRAVLIDGSKVVTLGEPGNVANEYKRLFSHGSVKEDTSTGGTGPSGEKRWGDDWANFEKISAQISKDNAHITITASLVANRDIEKPIFGFSIKNELLEQLIGTNTVRKGLKLKPLSKDEKAIIEWNVPNILNAGEYYIDCTIAHDDAISVADRWPDATAIKVYRDESNPYKVYSPDVTFKLTE